jgi:hypothetical protein
MKPANFPERKNQRRIRAYERLCRQLAESSNADDTGRLVREASRLEILILESARHIRTKKNHSLRSISTS